MIRAPCYRKPIKKRGICLRLVNELPKEKIRFFSGADQLGLLLLTQAANRLTYTIPLVYTEYAPGKGGATVPTYEDDKISVSAREHIYAAGAFPAKKAARADFILAVNTPFNGVMLEASDEKATGWQGLIRKNSWIK